MSKYANDRGSLSIYGDKPLDQRLVGQVGNALVKNLSSPSSNPDLNEFATLVKMENEKDNTFALKLGAKFLEVCEKPYFAKSALRQKIDDKLDAFSQKDDETQKNDIEMGTIAAAAVPGFTLSAVGGVEVFMQTLAAAGGNMFEHGLFGAVTEGTAAFVGGGACATSVAFFGLVGVGLGAVYGIKKYQDLTEAFSNHLNKLPDKQKEIIRSDMLKVWTKGQDINSIPDDKKQEMMTALDQIIPVKNENSMNMQKKS